MYFLQHSFILLWIRVIKGLGLLSHFTSLIYSIRPGFCFGPFMIMYLTTMTHCVTFIYDNNDDERQQQWQRLGRNSGHGKLDVELPHIHLIFSYHLVYTVQCFLRFLFTLRSWEIWKCSSSNRAIWPMLKVRINLN